MACQTPIYGYQQVLEHKMFLPLHDNTPLKIIRFQIVAGLIIAINFLLIVYTTLIWGGIDKSSIATSFGAVPALLTDFKVLPANLDLIPEPATLITYLFLHAGWMHFISNMAFVWVFADNVEDAFGHIGFLLFFLVCGIAAALAHTLAGPQSQSPLIGASGAISGVMAAYLVLFPKARIWVLMFLKLPLPIPAYLALAGWFAFQLYNSFMPQTGETIVAWWAHIGGFVAGGIIALALRGPLNRRLASKVST